jgi:MFS family permease
MAMSETIPASSKLVRAWDFLLAGRPLVGMAAILFTTTGHTMNLREFGAAQGWVTTEQYVLQSGYLISLSLGLLTCPTLAQRFSCRNLAQTGLILVAVGSFLNALAIWAPLSVFTAGRMLAGCGASLVIYCSPRLLDPRWEFPATWASIFLPVAGPGVISTASMLHETSNWSGSFLFEGAAAVFSLIVLVSMAEAPETPPHAPHGSLAYLPALILASAALCYCLHWGQLHGWLESDDIVAASSIGVVALIAAVCLAWPQFDFLALRESWIRLVLFFFGGLCQFLFSAVMNSYGGSLLNFSSWQRAWLIWPLPLGVATTLALSQLRWRRRRLPLGLPGAVVGLLLLAVGLYFSYQQTMEWPYWQVLDVLDLNWFPAPQHWQLAPGRFLMGLGIGVFVLAADTLFSPDPGREEKVRPFLLATQYFGGGLATILLVNFLLIGHAVHYSYAADRDYIQAGELVDRQRSLSAAISAAGGPDPDRAAEVLLYRFVNYEADNLVFATIYAVFFVVALILSGVCLALWVWRRPHAPSTRLIG